LSSAVLAARSLSKRFGALVVLDQVDFTVRSDEAVGIVGPNGAGKTTLLNVLAGSLHPDGGAIEFQGREITRSSATERSRLGIGRAHQVPRPFGDMTVFENVLVGAVNGGGYSGPAAHSRCLEVLEQCGLLDLSNRRAESLGLLHRKRLELARALAVDPAVVLLDEIGGGLTDEEAAELVLTIRELRRQGVAVVWIEHIVHVLVQVVDRLVCMDAGRVISEGSPQDVMADAAVIDAYMGGGEV
jgi:branched-chain amino acid transport system ATP-binding protein